MLTGRSNIDSKQLSTESATPLKTLHNVRCGRCGDIDYVDDEVFSFVTEAITAGLDYPFRCPACQRERWGEHDRIDEMGRLDDLMRKLATMPIPR